MTSIRSIMTADPICVRPDTPLREAVELLMNHGITGLPVVDADRRIVGVLSEKDLMRAFYEDAQSVQALMTREPATVRVDAELVDVFDILMAHNFRRLLAEEGGKLVGLVSRADLMPVVLDALLNRLKNRGG